LLAVILAVHVSPRDCASGKRQTPAGSSTDATELDQQPETFRTREFLRNRFSGADTRSIGHHCAGGDNDARAQSHIAPDPRARSNARTSANSCDISDYDVGPNHDVFFNDHV
jgi:hypothetical protein